MIFFRQNGEIWETYDQGMTTKTERFSNDFAVLGIMTDSWEKEQHLVLSYTNNIGHQNTVTCRRDEIVSVGLKAMKKNGFFVNPEREKCFAGAVHTFESFAKVVPIHQKLGMFNENGNLYFLGHESVGLPITSQYYGPAKIDPEGDLDVWLQMFREDVVPYPKVLFGFATAFSSPIVAVLKKKIENQALMVALCGPSGGGKSSTLKGAISIYGSPTVDGLLGDFNDTESYNIERMADSHGYLTALDEAVMKKNLDNFCYFGSNTISRGRVAPDGKRRERKMWAGTIMISCEGSALALTSGNTGTAVRMIEVSAEFTDSDTHAERIQEVCNDNYGLAILPYAELLVNKGLDAMEQDYNQCQNTLKQYIQKHNQKLILCHDFKRVLNRLTFILQAARYAVECFSVETYEEKAFMAFLTSVVASVLGYVEEQKEDLMDAIKAYIVTHKSNFVLMRDVEKKQPLIPEGQIYIYPGRTEVKMLKDRFDKIMREKGQNPTQAAQKLKAEGRIVSSHQHRNTCSLTLVKGVELAAYHLLIEKNPVGKPNTISKKEAEGLDGVDEIAEQLVQEFWDRMEQKYPKKEPQVKHLLADDDE